MPAVACTSQYFARPEERPRPITRHRPALISREFHNGGIKANE